MSERKEKVCEHDSGNYWMGDNARVTKVTTFGNYTKCPFCKEVIVNERSAEEKIRDLTELVAGATMRGDWKTAESYVSEALEAERKDSERLRELTIKAVQDEPEYPGEMPDEMFEALLDLAKKKDKPALEEWHRLSVRLTKKGILDRLFLLASHPEAPGD